jgi:hypothetical protein
LQVERESLFCDFSSQRLFHGLDLLFRQRRQQLSCRAVARRSENELAGGRGS